MNATAWLDDQEMRLWRNFIESANTLFADLDAELQRDHGLTLGDYEVLVYLSEAPDRQRRMCDLAVDLRLSPSGLTRRLDGLVRAGLVERRPSPADRRVSMAAITDDGYERLTNAAPDHVASVRRHMLDHLDRGQIETMGAGFEALRRARAERCAAACASAAASEPTRPS